MGTQRRGSANRTVGALSESVVATPSDMDATGNEAQAANPEVTVYAVQLHL